jgi:predicted RNA-binding Zn ribbon-like protein
MSQANFAPYLECSLNVAVDLVNTQDPLDGSDELSTLDELKSFVKKHEITRGPSKLTRKDLEETKALRARLRRVFDSKDEKVASSILNELIDETGARPQLTNHDGRWHMHYSPSGIPLAPLLAAEAAMALSVVIAQEGYDRLRTCEGDRCIDVFVDESKNHSRRFCSPNPCGNRASVKAFRERQRAAHSGE